MTNATPLRRALSALAATTLLAGGLLLGQTVTAPTARAATAATITCDIPKMRQQSHELRVKAAKLKQLGAREEARKVSAQADALDRRIQNCIDADENHKPWPR
ncbi:hypothetical protein ACIGO8_08575 [Streptomyces sp. NPDC053493]|uniref:hypothetical protein n=1 Tax=Streptomyces sp. NPDC053493 TaxID=3365705 RepID=UPI0037D34D5E